jgi:excisionase family DNA binding protein
MEKTLITVEQAADSLGIGRALAYQLVASGVLKSVKLGRLRRVPVAALTDLVEQLQKGG